MRPAALTLLLALAAAPAHAQSTDPAHPTPLGPGTNKGNIDNNVKGHFYVLTMGPGHVDADFAFKDMGLFGSPLRQALSFDILREDGTVTAHNAVVAQGALAHVHASGDLPEGRRVLLRITAQPGAIKLGGYYEVTLTGAVTFAGPTVGQNVVPQGSPPLINPMH